MIWCASKNTFFSSFLSIILKRERDFSKSNAFTRLEMSSSEFILMSGLLSQIKRGEMSLSKSLAFKIGRLSITDKIAPSISSMELSEPQSISAYVE